MHDSDCMNECIIKYDIIDELDVINRKYNRFANGGVIYKISLFDAMIYFLIFVFIGMCIGGMIKFLEMKCNKTSQIQIKQLNQSVK